MKGSKYFSISGILDEMPVNVAENAVLAIPRALADPSRFSSAAVLASDFSSSLASIVGITRGFDDSAFHRAMSSSAHFDHSLAQSQISAISRAIASLPVNGFEDSFGGAAAAAVRRLSELDDAILGLSSHTVLASQISASIAAIALDRHQPTSTLGALFNSFADFSTSHLHTVADQVTAVLQLTAGIMPHARADDLGDAVSRVRSDLVGAAAMAVGDAFPSYSRIAIEATAVLAMLDLIDDEEDATNDAHEVLDAPLVSSIGHLRHAVANGGDAGTLPEHISVAVNRIVAELRKLRALPRRSQFDLATVTSFLLFWISALALLISAAGLKPSAGTDSASTVDALERSPQDDRLREALTELVELQREEALALRERETAGSDAVDAPLYYVTRAIVVRERRDARSPRVATLYPGTPLRIAARSGQWAKVISFDHIRGEELSGWVRKKYLRRGGE